MAATSPSRASGGAGPEAGEDPESSADMTCLPTDQVKITDDGDELKVLSDDGRINAWPMAQLIRRNYKFLTFKDQDGEIYYYESGIYKPYGEHLIKTFIQGLYGSAASTHTVNETVNHIKRGTYADRAMIDDDSNYICLENGVLDITTGAFAPHSPLKVFLSKIPVNYDPAATCPGIDQFISEIVAEEDRELLYEVIAYCLVPGYPIQKAFMFVGTGNNGKSTYLNLVKTFLGADSCSSVTLQDLDKNRFASADLYGRRANICPDISNQELKRTGTFKGLTGGDSMRAEKKGQDSFNFENRAKMLFSCNSVPLSDDDSDAFYRRWVIVDLPYKFEGAALKLDMLERITTKAELSGLLNKVLPLCKKILEERGFSKAGSTEATRLKYVRLSDSVYCFFDLCCTVNNGVIDECGSIVSAPGVVRKVDLYRAYVDFCRDERLSPLKEGKFHRKIQEHAPNISEVRVKESGQTVRCWRGLELNTPVEIEENKKQSTLGQF